MATTETLICNWALGHIGITKQLTSVSGLIAAATPASDEARMSVQYYEGARDSVLTDFAWPFAAKFALLTLANPGDGEVWEGEWDNAYAYPGDCLILRRFLTNAFTGTTIFPNLANEHDFENPPFEIKSIAGALVIFTDVQEDLANVEYTSLVTNAALFPVRFASALSWRLAYEMGAALRADPVLIQNAARLYAFEVDAARRSYGNESDPRSEGDGEFLQSRNS